MLTYVDIPLQCLYFRSLTSCKNILLLKVVHEADEKGHGSSVVPSSRGEGGKITDKLMPLNPLIGRFSDDVKV